MNTIDYITTHWSDIITALTSIIIAARIIVKITPTPEDDTFLDKTVEVLKHIGLVVKDKAQIILAFLCLLCLSSCALDPAVKQQLITDGTGILITGGQALLVSGGNGGAALTAMSSEAVADVPGLRQVIKDSAAKSAKNPTTPVTISVTPATPVTP